MNPTENQNTKRDFDKEAAAWDEKPERVKLAADIAAAIRAHLPLTEQMDVLDLGCGTGLVTLDLSGGVRKIVGMDSSQGMLEVLSAKARAGGFANVETVLADDIKFGEYADQFHVIVSAMMLHHVEDIERLFRHCFAHLAPDGKIAFADLDKEDGSFHPDNTGVFHFGFHRYEIESAVKNAGFEEICFFDASVIEKPGRDGTSRPYKVFLVTARR